MASFNPIDDHDLEVWNDAHVQHGHPPIADISVRLWTKWDEWSESMNRSHQRYRIFTWSLVVKPHFECYYRFNEEERGTIKLPDIKLPPEPPESDSYEEAHEYLVEAFEKSLAIALPDNTHDKSVKVTHTKNSSPSQDIFPFRHLNVSDHSSTIRILEIVPGPVDDPIIETQLLTADLHSIEDQYEALSYTWGDNNTGRVRVNGCIRAITPALYEALLSLRLPDRRRAVWVDSLCINQEDLDERMQQVLLMAKIYKMAKHVIVYLGPSTSKSTALIKFMNADIHIYASSEEKSLDTQISHRQKFKLICEKLGVDEKDVEDGFIDVSCRSWWTRVWTKQEYVLSKRDPIFYCGRESFASQLFRRKFSDFFDWVEHVKQHPLPLNNCFHIACYEPDRNDEEVESQNGVESDKKKGLARRFESMFPAQASLSGEWATWGHQAHQAEAVLGRRHRCRPWNTPDCEYKLQQSNCSNPRDIVYGLRELMEPVFRDIFKPDYTIPVPKLFARLAAYLLIFDSWTDLFFCYPHRIQPEIYGLEDDSDIPSWTPDFTRPARLHEAERGPATKKRVPRKLVTAPIVVDKILFMSGWLVDEIVSVYPLPIGDPFKVLQQLWHFERKHGRPAYKLIENLGTRSDGSEGIKEAGKPGPFEQMCSEYCGVTPYPSIAWATNYGNDLPSDVSLVHVIYNIRGFASILTDTFAEYIKKIPGIIRRQNAEKKHTIIKEQTNDDCNQNENEQSKSPEDTANLERDPTTSQRPKDGVVAVINRFLSFWKFIYAHVEDFVGICTFDYCNLRTQIREQSAIIDLREVARLGIIDPEPSVELDDDAPLDNAIIQRPWLYLELLVKIYEDTESWTELQFRMEAVAVLARRINEKARDLVGVKRGNSHASTKDICGEIHKQGGDNMTAYEVTTVPLPAILRNILEDFPNLDQNLPRDTGEEDLVEDGDADGSNKGDSEVEETRQELPPEDREAKEDTAKPMGMSEVRGHSIEEDPASEYGTETYYSYDTESVSSSCPPAEPGEDEAEEQFREWPVGPRPPPPASDVHIVLSSLADFLEGRDLFVTESGLMGLSTPGTKQLSAGDDVFLLAGMTCPLVGRLKDKAALKDDNGMRIPRRVMSSIRMPREILGSAILKDIETHEGDLDKVVWPEGFEPISDKGAFRFE
ncbi:heterokaryon incompatibility protein-domain-containing protein [Biscogniauxia sp. FL1348]|nr:heterokaryon incompatibility protein-domain-containing protein [Biscogniauxia sp. FL1348]